MPVTNGDGAVEKLCGDKKVSFAVHVVAASIFLLSGLFGMNTYGKAGHKVAKGGGCFGPKAGS